MRVNAVSPWSAAISPGPTQVPGTQESSGNMCWINYWNLCISPSVWYNPGPSVWKTQVKNKNKNPRSQSKREKTLNLLFLLSLSSFSLTDWSGEGKDAEGGNISVELKALSPQYLAPTGWGWGGLFLPGPPPSHGSEGNYTVALAYSLHIHQRKAKPSFPSAVNGVVGDSRENAMRSYFLGPWICYKLFWK